MGQKPFTVVVTGKLVPVDKSGLRGGPEFKKEDKGLRGKPSEHGGLLATSVGVECGQRAKASLGMSTTMRTDVVWGEGIQGCWVLAVSRSPQLAD
jgi:hypothetical protein